MKAVKRIVEAKTVTQLMGSFLSEETTFTEEIGRGKEEYLSD